MKIAEIEEMLIKGDCSKETIELFKAALRRVPKASRCQHCYTTAVDMKPDFSEQAIDLIQYGLDMYCEYRVDRMRSYHNMAIVFERSGDYRGALDAYRQALLSIDEDKTGAYEPEYAFHMMRMEMHISGFAYTDELHKYYEMAIQADEFSRAFQTKAFYRAVSEIIIFSKQGKLKEAQNAYQTAIEMLQPNYTGPLTLLLKRKGFLEAVDATKETLAFLKKSKQLFKNLN